MKLIIIITTLLINCTINKDSPTAYICDNGKTTKYHVDSKCAALKNCTFKIVKTTVDKAKKSGKTLCGKEK